MEASQNSTRGRRSSAEIESKGCYLRSFSSILFNLNDTAFAILCNEVDLMKVDKSILYLQNDPGESFHIIITGSVSFFFEQDRKVQNALQLQHQREYLINDTTGTECYSVHLGQYVTELKGGEVFGDIFHKVPAAKKARQKLTKPQTKHNTHKPPEDTQLHGRLCSAVAADNTTLLVVYLDTFKRTLQSYFSQGLSSTAQQLRKMPLFARCSPSTLLQIAHNATKQQYAYNNLLAPHDSAIECVYIIFSGKVRVSSGTNNASLLVKSGNVQLTLTASQVMPLEFLEPSQEYQSRRMAYILQDTTFGTEKDRSIDLCCMDFTDVCVSKVSSAEPDYTMQPIVEEEEDVGINRRRVSTNKVKELVCDVPMCACIFTSHTSRIEKWHPVFFNVLFHRNKHVLNLNIIFS